jgi:hypothetical protein
VSRRAVIGVVLALAASAALTLWAFRSGDSHAAHGPLALPAQAKASIGVPIPEGKPYSYGLLAVVNRSAKSVVLDQAELVNRGTGVRLIGAYTLPVPNEQAIGFVKGYSPRGRFLKGALITPHAQVQIVLGVKVVKSGRYRFEAVALRYHVGGTSFHDAYPTSGRFCSPMKKYLNHCPGLLDEQKAS